MDIKYFQPLTIGEWHDWLLDNYLTAREIWLVYTRRSVNQCCVGYEETIEEALCFGWIDGVIKRLDDERYARKFMPRKPGSNWSKLNLSRGRRMVEEERMTEHGLAFFLDGLAQKTTDGPTRREEQEVFRKELEILLSTETLEIYHALPDSLQRQYASWVMSARKEETRQRRIEELKSTLAKGERLGLK